MAHGIPVAAVSVTVAAEDPVPGHAHYLCPGQCSLTVFLYPAPREAPHLSAAMLETKLLARELLGMNGCK